MIRELQQAPKEKFREREQKTRVYAYTVRYYVPCEDGGERHQTTVLHSTHPLTLGQAQERIKPIKGAVFVTFWRTR